MVGPLQCWYNKSTKHKYFVFPIGDWNLRYCRFCKDYAFKVIRNKPGYLFTDVPVCKRHWSGMQRCKHCNEWCSYKNKEGQPVCSKCGGTPSSSRKICKTCKSSFAQKEGKCTKCHKASSSCRYCKASGCDLVTVHGNNLDSQPKDHPIPNFVFYACNPCYQKHPFLTKCQRLFWSCGNRTDTPGGDPTYFMCEKHRVKRKVVCRVQGCENLKKRGRAVCSKHQKVMEKERAAKRKRRAEPATESLID
jgi:hypothetical protein